MARNSPPSPPTWDERLISNLMPWRVELAGATLFLMAMVTLLALPGWSDAGWLHVLTSLLRQAFGWGAYPLCLSLALAGLHIALRKWERPYHIRPKHVIGFELILVTLLPLSHLASRATLATAHLGRGGGLAGWALSEPLIEFFGPLLTLLLYLVLLAWGVALVAGAGWEEFLGGLSALSVRLASWAQRVAPQRPLAVTANKQSRAPVVTSGRPRSPEPEELIIIDGSAASATPKLRR